MPTNPRLVEIWLVHFAIAGMGLVCYVLLVWALAARLLLGDALRSLTAQGPAAR